MPSEHRKTPRSRKKNRDSFIEKWKNKNTVVYRVVILVPKKFELHICLSCGEEKECVNILGFASRERELLPEELENRTSTWLCGLCLTNVKKKFEEMGAIPPGGLDKMVRYHTQIKQDEIIVALRPSLQTVGKDPLELVIAQR